MADATMRSRRTVTTTIQPGVFPASAVRPLLLAVVGPCAVAGFLCFGLRAQAGSGGGTGGAAPRPTAIAAAQAAMRDGSAAVARNDLREAQRQFARAVALVPKVAASHGALGSVLYAQGSYAAAQGELEKAHTLAPADPAIGINLARVDVALRRYPEAVALFRDALAGSPAPVLSAEESMDDATALSVTGDLPGAQAVLAGALGREPGAAVLEDGLGAVLAQAGRMDDAVAHFERAVSLDAALLRAQVHLGAALVNLGRPEQAIAPLQSVAGALPRDFEAQLQFGRALSAVHRDAEALEALHRAGALRDGASAGSLYALALALQASGDPAGALAVFAATTASGTGLSQTELSAALTNYALAKVQTGDAAGALPLYARALALGQDSAVLREDYGVAFLQKAELDHAVDQFRAGLRLEPENAQLHYDLGLALKLKDDLPGAVPEFERAAALEPTLPDPPFTLGIIAMQQGRYPEAAVQLRRVTALQPGNGAAWAALGGVLKDSGAAAEATSALKRAVELQPEQPNLHIQLAGLLTAEGRTADAAAERKIAAELSRAAVSRQRAEFALKSGRALLAEGKLPEATAQLTTAAEADPKLSEPHRLLADVLAREGKQAEAADERRRAATLDRP